MVKLCTLSISLKAAVVRAIVTHVTFPQTNEKTNDLFCALKSKSVDL